MTELEALKILKEKEQAARLEPAKMKRLTKRVEDGSAVYYLYGFGAFDKLEALEECVDRLAAYEDTGLTSEEITALIAPNDPLTLEELREMDGEPVWCVDGRRNQCWCLVNCDDGLPCCYDNETGLWEGYFYGMTGDGRFGLHQSGWLAYRRKPEEGTE